MTEQEIRELLDTHTAALAEADQMRCVWAEKAEGLRQIVAGYKRLLKAHDPRQQSLEITIGDTSLNETLTIGTSTEAEEVAQTTEAEAPAAPDGPRGEEAIRVLLAESPRPQSPKALTDAIRRRGWIRPDAAHPEDAVRAALGRMRAKGTVVRVGTGLYALPNGDAPSLEPREGGQRP
jgi:hypothetical protein